MDNTYLHLYLYAKNWYKKSPDIVADLRKIVARIANVDEEDVTEKEITYFLLHETFKFMHYETTFLVFIQDLNPKYAWKNGFPLSREYDFDEILIWACLSQLQLATIQEVPELSGFQPDYTILPSSREEDTVIPEESQ